MKKKIILFLIIAFLTFGCTNVKKMSIDSVLNEIANKAGKQNEFNSAFKFYLPNGMKIVKYDSYNEVLSSEKYIYYLYVDIINYYEKNIYEYVPCSECFYSKKIDYDNKNGYVNIILQKNNKYLIEIMYNYAKIEVMVDYDDINLALLNSVSILRDLEYNDMIIESLVSNKSKNFTEETYNIFKKDNKDSNYLDKVTSDEDNFEITNKDTDLVD
mgnify:CR=1 FL=1